jgi:uncharacterized membrane protein
VLLRILGKDGREAIARAYPASRREAKPPGELAPVIQVIRHNGDPAYIQDVDEEALVSAAREADGIVMIPHATGDLLQSEAPLAVVLGAPRLIADGRVARAVLLGPDRVMYRDPASAVTRPRCPLPSDRTASCPKDPRPMPKGSGTRARKATPSRAAGTT